MSTKLLGWDGPVSQDNFPATGGDQIGITDSPLTPDDEGTPGSVFAAIAFGDSGIFGIYRYVDGGDDVLVAETDEVSLDSSGEYAEYPLSNVYENIQLGETYRLCIWGDGQRNLVEIESAQPLTWRYVNEVYDAEGLPGTLDVSGSAANRAEPAFYVVSSEAAPTPGIPGTTLNNADGTASTGTAITRTITRVSDSLQLFTGSQTSDATTGELPAIDLSETDAAVDDVVEDSVSIDGATAPGVKSTTVLRTVGDLGA